MFVIALFVMPETRKRSIWEKEAIEAAHSRAWRACEGGPLPSPPHVGTCGRAPPVLSGQRERRGGPRCCRPGRAHQDDIATFPRRPLLVPRGLSGGRGAPGPPLRAGRLARGRESAQSGPARRRPSARVAISLVTTQRDGLRASERRGSRGHAGPMAPGAPAPHVHARRRGPRFVVLLAHFSLRGRLQIHPGAPSLDRPIAMAASPERARAFLSRIWWIPRDELAGLGFCGLPSRRVCLAAPA